jgi:hypothetical protein
MSREVPTDVHPTGSIGTRRPLITLPPSGRTQTTLTKGANFFVQIKAFPLLGSTAVSAHVSVVSGLLR